MTTSTHLIDIIDAGGELASTEEYTEADRQAYHAYRGPKSKKDLNKSHDIQSKTHTSFSRFVRAEVGTFHLTDEAHKLIFEKADSDGHSSGYESVLSLYEDYVEFFEKVAKANR